MLRPLLLSLALLLPFAARAQHAEHEGGGEASGSEARWGTVTFPTSASPEAHEAFLRGVRLLHSFHYPEAAAAFREAQTLDPGDVMAYWGEALTYTHPIWNEQDVDAARGALERLAPTREARQARARTPREAAYLDAVEWLYEGTDSKSARDRRYSDAMSRVRAAYPDDPEAAAFYSLSLLGLGQGDRVPDDYARAAAVADSLFRLYPRHPGAAHYLIHAVDDPEHAPQGLDAARAYSEIAPDASHAQHMTSHIFVAMGMWDDVVRANERSEVLLGTNRRGHATLWLVYGLTQQGRYRMAERWLDSLMIQLDATAAQPGRNRGTRYHISAAAAAYIVDAQAWDHPLATFALDTTGLGYDAAPLEFAQSIAALEHGDRDRAAEIADRIGMRPERLRAAGMIVEGQPRSSARGYSEVMYMTLFALIMAHDGELEYALNILEETEADEASLPMAFGPPPVVKQPAEVAGDLLFEAGRADEAREAYLRALRRTPGRPSVLLGLARAEALAGHEEAAAEHYAQLARIWHDADPDVPALEEARRTQ